MSETKRSLGKRPLIYPLPVLLVGSYDKNGKANLMTAAWGGICCSEPLSLTVSVRAERWTHDAILERKAFTVGIPTEGMAQAADYVGMASGRRYDKFTASGLTPVRSQLVDAPYAAECPVVLECALTHTLDLGTHTLMVGRIEDVKADEQCLGPEGAPSLDRFAPLVYEAGTGMYHVLGRAVAKAFSVGKPLFKEEA